MFPTGFKKFQLSENFIKTYRDVKPPFGFNGLGEFVYMRTYSRIKEDGKNEVWWETVRRVVEGTFSLQKWWIDEQGLGWNAHKAQALAHEMYDRMFHMKFLPPGRGLWAMGSNIIEEKGLGAALNNCSYISTIDLQKLGSRPFLFLMDMSMLGVGVGFDTKGAGSLVIQQPLEKVDIFVVPDSREGWVESVRLLLDSYFIGGPTWGFDYSLVRPAGSPIKTFGGVSSGPAPLMQLHQNLRDTLNREVGQPISETTIVDIANQIGVCVVSGNLRRSAEIAIGSWDSDEFLKLKDYHWDDESGAYTGSQTHRAGFGWASNNTVNAELGIDYKKLAQQTGENGEPGYIWLENMQKYGRMADAPNYKDKEAAGTNPCSEQTLFSWENCCLVETFPAKHESLEDFSTTLKFAYLYAKTVTLVKTHWPETNRVMLRNRRIGLSLSGVAQFISTRGLHTLKQWCEEGSKVVEHYDEVYSNWFVIPRSIKTRSIKPSGTVSLLAGATPGVHYPESNYHIRRVRVAKDNPLLEPLKESGYRIEQAYEDPDTSVVVEFPVEVVPAGGTEIRSVSEVSIWEQVALAAFLQAHWSDNQVSVTVKFHDHEKDQIAPILNYYQYQLKGVSFLPHGGKIYPQMPYEPVTREQYLDYKKSIKPVDFSGIEKNEIEAEKFCNNDVCTI